MTHNGGALWCASSEVTPELGEGRSVLSGPSGRALLLATGLSAMFWLGLIELAML